MTSHQLKHTGQELPAARNWAPWLAADSRLHSGEMVQQQDLRLKLQARHNLSENKKGAKSHRRQLCCCLGKHRLRSAPGYMP